VIIPYYVRKGRVPWHTVVPLALAALLLFEIYNVFRTLGTVKPVLQWGGIGGIGHILANALIAHTISFDNAVILLEGLSRGAVGFLWGKSYVLLPLHIVPRALWPDKPVLSPTTLFTRAFFGEPGTYVDGRLITAQTVTAPMELYWQGGVLAVVLGMWLVGVAARRVYNFAKNATRKGNVFGYVFYSWFAFQLFNSMRDSVFSFLPFVVLFWISWRIVFTLCSRTQQEMVEAHVGKGRTKYAADYN